MEVKCKYCDKTFTKRGIATHIRFKHPEASPKDNSSHQPEAISPLPCSSKKFINTSSKNNSCHQSEIDSPQPYQPEPVSLQLHSSAKSISTPLPSKRRKKGSHWLNITSEDGAILSQNCKPEKSRSKGYYNFDELTNKYVENEKYDEQADWFKISCKYCNEVLTKFDLRKHYVDAHLQADEATAFFPNVFHAPSTSFAGTLPFSDSAVIDFSLGIQDDPLLKYDRVIYSSYFHCDNSSFNSSNELLKHFRYTVVFGDQYSFNYVCSICKENMSFLSPNLLKLTVLAHLRVQHRDNKLIVKMTEAEIRCFNKAFGTNFKLFVDLKHGPRLPSDLLLTGLEANFMRENAHGDYDVTGRFYPCKLCLSYFPNEIWFKRHLIQKHAARPIKMDAYNFTLVEPHQILTDKSFLGVNAWYPLAFAKDENKYTWCCILCGLHLKENEIGHLLAKIGAHFLSKKFNFGRLFKIYAMLTQCTSFEQMNIFYDTLQWNCLQYQGTIQSNSSNMKLCGRTCSFCSKNYSLPKLLDDETAEILHVVQDHEKIGSNNLLLRYLINFGASEKFPFLDVLFGDILDMKPNKRRFRCAKCFIIFKNIDQLIVHGRLHLNNHEMKSERYFFVLPCNVLNLILSTMIDGASDYDKFPECKYDVYLCISCLEVMNPDGSHNHVQMTEHIKSCKYLQPSIPLNKIPTELKEIPFKTLTSVPKLCSKCGKRYITSYLAKQCCLFGQPLPVFSRKRSSGAITEDSEEVQGGPRRQGLTKFTFKNFSF